MTNFPKTERAVDVDVCGDDHQYTLADVEASAGRNPDPTGDLAAGRYRFFASTEEFVASLRSVDH